MRIAVSGTVSAGKSELVKEFLKTWTTYTAPSKTYHDLLVRDDDTNVVVSKESQQNILDFMIDQLQESTKDDNIIYNACLIDNLVHTLWGFEKDDVDIDDSFVKKSVQLVRESMCFYDIVFFIPVTKASPINVKKDGTKETEPFYIKEIDTIFKAIEEDWNTNPKCQFCKADDRPAIIEIFGKLPERIQMVKLYLDVDGDAIDDVGILDQYGNIKDDSGIIQPYQ
tara:strand:+ start:229 stop:903 length:675 start_codon:yes stop_codon:yes gene_type:complete